MGAQGNSGSLANTESGDLHRQAGSAQLDRAHPRDLLPGEPGIWLLLIFDLFQFTLFFSLFSYHRGRNAALFERSARELHVSLGFINTLILITGSVCVAVALRNWSDGGSNRGAARLFYAGAGAGALFATIKVAEYILTASSGNSVGRNEFFMFYFCVTGFHLVHAIAGSIALLFAGRAVSRSTVQPSSERSGAIYTVGLFWHFVDLIWVILFVLLYIS